MLPMQHLTSALPKLREPLQVPTRALKGTCQRSEEEWLSRFATMDEWKNLVRCPFRSTFYSKTRRTSRSSLSTLVYFAWKQRTNSTGCRRHPASPASEKERRFAWHGWEMPMLGCHAEVGVMVVCHGERWDVHGSSGSPSSTFFASLQFPPAAGYTAYCGTEL
ncbi:hypothetical protein BDV97DRAFT_346154 [Delphinella strobiligena]|nr:hypothetical protein BDV97DRAFT_346154 [Delphinella strobiligena]